jgi:hypothetical protein
MCDMVSNGSGLNIRGKGRPKALCFDVGSAIDLFSGPNAASEGTSAQFKIPLAEEVDLIPQDI